LALQPLLQLPVICLQLLATFLHLLWRQCRLLNGFLTTMRCNLLMNLLLRSLPLLCPWQWQQLVVMLSSPSIVHAAVACWSCPTPGCLL
jgi:hypothetical protein